MNGADANIDMNEIDQALAEGSALMYPNGVIGVDRDGRRIIEPRASDDVNMVVVASEDTLNIAASYAAVFTGIIVAIGVAAIAFVWGLDVQSCFLMAVAGVLPAIFIFRPIIVRVFEYWDRTGYMD